MPACCQESPRGLVWVYRHMRSVCFLPKSPCQSLPAPGSPLWQPALPALLCYQLHNILFLQGIFSSPWFTYFSSCPSQHRPFLAGRLEVSSLGCASILEDDLNSFLVLPDSSPLPALVPAAGLKLPSWSTTCFLSIYLDFVQPLNPSSNFVLPYLAP